MYFSATGGGMFLKHRYFTTCVVLLCAFTIVWTAVADEQQCLERLKVYHF